MTTYDNGDDVDVLGVVILTRNGDSQGFYQDPASYQAVDVSLTPLGENQSWALGSLLRSRYVAQRSLLTVPSLSLDLFHNDQARFKADAGGNSTVMVDSAIAIAQGLYPPTRESKEILADGVEITSPLGGYQYVAVESVEPDQDVSLRGWTDCKNFDDSVQEQLKSSNFRAKGSESEAFFNNIKPFLGDRPSNFDNAWNIYDYMNVQYTHNSIFRSQVSAPTISHARSLASYHQWNLFSDPNPMHIRNIAGRTVIPDIVNGLQKMADLNDQLGMVVLSASHQPFLSLFRMLKITDNHPEMANIVNYAGALAFELRRPYTTQGVRNTKELVVRLNFRNGTLNYNFVPYTMLGRPLGTYDVPFEEFTSTLKEWGVSGLSQWCNVCGTSDARGCNLISRVESHGLSPIASGFVGAAVALVVSVLLISALLFTGLLNWRSKAQRRKSTTSSRLSAIIPGRNKGISPDAESQQQVNDNGFELRDDISVISKISEKIEHS